MAEKSPLVFVDGGISELPLGDTIEGFPAGSIVTESGLDGGGSLQSGATPVNVALTAQPSGLIFVDQLLSLDGADLAAANQAETAATSGIVIAEEALASGVAAQEAAQDALTISNAALDAAVNFVGGSQATFEAGSSITPGQPVGFDDNGLVQNIQSSGTPSQRDFLPADLVSANGNSNGTKSAFDYVENAFLILYVSSTGLTGVKAKVIGDSLVYGSPVTINNQGPNNGQGFDVAYDSNSQVFLIVWSNPASGSQLFGVMADVKSPGTVRFSSAAVINSNASGGLSLGYNPIYDKFVVFFADQGLSQGQCIAFNYTGSTGSVGSGVEFNSGSQYQFSSINVYTTTCTYNAQYQWIEFSYIDTNRAMSTGFALTNSSNLSLTIGGVNSTGPSLREFSPISMVWDSRKLYSVLASTAQSNNLGEVSTVYYDNPSSVFSRGTSYVVGDGASTADNTALNIQVANIVSSTEPNYEILLTWVDTTSITRIQQWEITAFNTMQRFNNGSVLTAPAISVPRESLAIGTNINAGQALITYNASSTSSILGQYSTNSFSFSPTVNGYSNFIGVAKTTVASGQQVDVDMPKSLYETGTTSLNTGSFYYVDPALSSFTTSSGIPTGWQAVTPWGPVAKAVSASGLLILSDQG